MLGGKKHLNDNSDIDVEFENGDFYAATAFTYENLTLLKDKNSETGECLSGKYFWAKGMLFVDSLERSVIEEIVHHLLEEDEFKDGFYKVQATKTIWVFNGATGLPPGGIFEVLEDASRLDSSVHSHRNAYGISS
mgnify:CR=1 FL=1